MGLITVFKAERIGGRILTADVTQNPDGTHTTGPFRPLPEAVAEHEREAAALRALKHRERKD